ncbi:hypothetical protein CNR22_02275 [Sphingobacteriaceae bacterium]|nr:hypothetical protein CNR22_02275 [Sphingobacteriaceae bacterium]
MTKILLLVFLLCSLYKNAQNTCYTASTICNNSTFNVGPGGGIGVSNTLSISNPVNDPFPPNAGCLKSGAVNPTWMIFTVANSGSLGFSIGDSTSPNPQISFHDWILWPYSATTCSAILNNTLPPLRCNWNAAMEGGTGIGNLPVGASSSNYEPALNVNSGDQFILLLDNYSGVNTTLTFSSTGTASLNCNTAFNGDVYTCPNKSTNYMVNDLGWSNTSFTLNPGNLIQSSPFFTLSTPVSQIYTVTVSGTNTLTSLQQTFTSTFAFHILPPANLIAVSDTSICEGESVAMSFSPTVNFSVNVAGPGNYTQSFSNPANGIIVISPYSTGIYLATTSYTPGCTLTLMVYIDVQNLVKFTTVSANNLCEGESVTLGFSAAENFSTFVTGPNAYYQSFPAPSSGWITFVPAGSGGYSATISYTNGCSASSTVMLVLDACTNLNKDEVETVRIWPNPVKDYLYFTDQQPISAIEITDISGVTLKLLPEHNRINLTNFKEGIYTLKFYTAHNAEFRTRRIIIK